VFRLLGFAEHYQRVRVDVLNVTEMGIVNAMNEAARLEGATMSQLAMALREVSKLRRLETGQPTSASTVFVGTTDLRGYAKAAQPPREILGESVTVSES